MKLTISLGVIALTVAQTALAAPFTEIRIGDVDGFGFTSDVPSRFAASGAPADSNGNGQLQQTEFLPDRNRDGFVQVTTETSPGSGVYVGFDDFDNRSNAERGGNVVSGAGFVNTGTTGSDLTDISLSASYDPLLPLGLVYSSPGNPLPGLFPTSVAPSLTLPNQPGFKFRFDVAKADIDSSQDIYFNVLFGDYDVAPADLEITKNGGEVLTLQLSTQPLAADGLIQGLFATLGFFDVFSDGGTVWNGYLDVDFDAPGEPYTAFDFVELSTTPISPEPVPAPATLLLLGLGLLATLAGRRQRRA